MAATLSETCVLNSSKYVLEPAMSIPNLSETLRFFWSHSSFFSLEKHPKKLNSHGLFTSKRSFGDYFQWKACTHFLKVRSRERYNEAKIFTVTRIFLVALIWICFRKVAQKSKFSEFFYLLRRFWWLLSVKRIHPLPDDL